MSESCDPDHSAREKCVRSSMVSTKKQVILWLGPRVKHLAPVAFVITLYNGEALVPSLDLAGHHRGFLPRREGLPIEGRVGPENMIVNR